MCVRTGRLSCEVIKITSLVNKIAEAEAVVSVNDKDWLVMQMHVQMRLDELRGPPNPWLTVT